MLTYKSGRTKSVSNVANINPPITTVAKGRCTSAPAPLLSAIGIKPREATAAVINTGRKRLSPPSITILTMFLIPDLYNLLNSEIKTIPFKTATPKRAIKPTAALMLKGIPRKFNINTPPMTDNGMAV